MPGLRPDPDHSAVLQSEAARLVVTAPPGTGKTALSIRVAAAEAQKLEAGSRVLLLTFSKQARTQLETEAARQLAPQTRSRIEITNYHRFFWQGVLAYRRALGLPMELSVGSRARRRRALEEHPFEWPESWNDQTVDSMAEFGFEHFQDHRTPHDAMVTEGLVVARQEQQSGRLIFGDLGALFWRMLEDFPAIDRAYRSRYPVVVADEHQDASALQDSVVRRLGTDRRLIFADPMQLIHGFRGATAERTQRHVQEAEEVLTLRTPHRWHGRRSEAEWLVGVRHRLQGQHQAVVAPPTVTIRYGPARRGLNGLKPHAKSAVARAFGNQARSVAVLARTNEVVEDFRSYLTRQGLFPTEVGSAEFEDARKEIEEVGSLPSHQAVAHRAVDRIESLVPGIDSQVIAQIRQRSGESDVDLSRAGERAAIVLRPLRAIYRLGPRAYVHTLSAAIDALRASGLHTPRRDAVHCIKTAVKIMGNEPPDFDTAIQIYADAVLADAHRATHTQRGLFVMTAHQSKGKEFDEVVLADLGERYWPDNAEMRRLLYVAITRASRRWTLLAPEDSPSPLVSLLI